MPWFVVMTLVLFVPLVFVNYYSGRKIFKALVEAFKWNRKRVKWMLISMYAYLNLLPLVYAVLFFTAGREATVWFTGVSFPVDLFLVYPFWFALVVNFQLFLIFLLIDLGNLVRRRALQAQAASWERFQPRIIVVIALVILVYSCITASLNSWTVRFSEHNVDLLAKFSNLDSLRIAQISDVQGDGRVTQNRLLDYVQRVNALEPDVVLFAGDLVSSGERYIESTSNILGHLKSKYGTYAAVGDHDIFSNKAKVMESLTANGVTVLDDSSIVVHTNRGNLEITGITYTYRQRPNESSLDRATDGADGNFKILLSHQPANRLVEYANQKGYNLFLAGHTHGGGIAFGIPGLFLFAPASLETHYLSGLYRVGDMVVSVTNGLGFTLAPIRFHAPAEYTLLRLVK